jgi:hypothetical protein
MHCVAVLKY